jgi:serine/threonine protein kinase/tetratricopeptide (TPR) repeat protein
MSSVLLGNRYQIIESIDEGGMGTVYRAWDYLNEQMVAIKRVKALDPAPVSPDAITRQIGSSLIVRWASGDLMQTPQSDPLHDTPTSVSRQQPTAPTPLDLAQDPYVVVNSAAVPAPEAPDQFVRLAQEFRTLASLRHPNILSVLDYGFDKERRPFLVMELLDRATDICTASDMVMLPQKMDFILQLLQALVYLHRQRIIHCDIKPGNVLVLPDQSLKVLDFGLALRSESGVLSAGTLAYVAPEILFGEPPSPVTDLYAVGVMMCEILQGRHPFAVDDFEQLVNDVMYLTPDLSYLHGESPALAEIVARLTAKDPQERYTDAHQVIQAIHEALERPTPQETTSIRESFLQAATFVGRADELGLLMEALHVAHLGQGSAWLIGGETGVGKSRLLDEFRSLALVEGALVIRGQNPQGNPIYYQMWREVLRPLVISTKLSDLEASVLKAIIPDLSRLLNRTIPDAPPLIGEQEQQRLAMTIAEVLFRQRHLTVLLLEDLHWAEESLAPLQLLSQWVPNLPMMVIGTYRSDEQPYLYGDLPAMQHLHVRRLVAPEIADLSYAMLGTAGQNERLLDFLITQSEGNTLFIVETLRSLAEETGKLDAVPQHALPDYVFSSEIQAVIQRRLKHLPYDVQPFVQLAAVGGRTLDLRLFEQIYQYEMAADDTAPNYLDWLGQCVDAALVELVDGKWRFSHDRIRDAALHDLLPDQRAILHSTMAQAIEAVYGDDLDYVSSLADLWEQAGDVERAGHYAALAARQANHACEYRKAMTYVATPLARRHSLPAETVLAALLELAVAQGSVGDFAQATTNYEAAIDLAQRHQQTVTEAVAHEGLGLISRRYGSFDKAKAHYLTSMAVYHEIGDRRSTAAILNQLARLDFMQGHYDEIQTFAAEALAIFNELEDMSGASASLTVMALVPLVEGDLATARTHLTASLDLRRKIGDRYGTMSVLCDLGRVLHMQNQNDMARQTLEEALQISRQINDQWHTAQALNQLAQVAFNEGDLVAAHYYLLEALQIGVTLKASPVLVGSLIGLARLMMHEGDFTQSAELLGLIQSSALSHSGFIQVALRPLVSGLLETMPPDQFHEAIQRGNHFDLYETAEDMLVQG